MRGRTQTQTHTGVRTAGGMLVSVSCVRPLVLLARGGGPVASGPVQEEAVWALRGLAVEQAMGHAMCAEVEKHDGVSMLLGLCQAVMEGLSIAIQNQPEQEQPVAADAPAKAKAKVAVVGNASRVQEHSLWALALLAEAAPPSAASHAQRAVGG